VSPLGPTISCPPHFSSSLNFDFQLQAIKDGMSEFQIITSHRSVDFLGLAKREMRERNIQGSAASVLTCPALATLTDLPHPTLHIRPSDLPIAQEHASEHPLSNFIHQQRPLTARQISAIVRILNLEESLPATGVMPASTTPYSDYRDHGWPRDTAISAYTLIDAGDPTHGFKSLFNLLHTLGSDEVRGRLTTAFFHPDPYAHFADPDCWRAPPARYLIVNGRLQESAQPWNHFQLDSLGLVPWVFFRLANEGRLDLGRVSHFLTKQGSPHEAQESILVVWLRALHHMRFAEQSDFSMWEDHRLPSRASSIGACTAAFAEARQFFRANGFQALPHWSTTDLEETLEQGFHSGHAVLSRRIPADGGFACETDRFPADSALCLNLLCDPSLSTAQQDAILRTLYHHRMEPLGFSRRDEDAYMGQNYAHRKDGEGIWGEPQGRPALWGLFDNVIGDFLCRRGVRTGNIADIALGERHLRRSLCYLTPHPDHYLRQSDQKEIRIGALTVPEAYWWCTEQGRYRPNCNTPLLMGVGALARQLKSTWLARRMIEEGTLRQAA
jgi:hypothetical protein